MRENTLKNSVKKLIGKKNSVKIRFSLTDPKTTFSDLPPPLLVQHETRAHSFAKDGDLYRIPIFSREPPLFQKSLLFRKRYVLSQKRRIF